MRRPSDTALHEAGHAVVAYILGYKVLDVVVHQDRTGYCNVRFRVPRDKRAKWRAECPITVANILMAGHEAEVLWCGRKLTSMPSSDLGDLKKLGISWTGINIQREQLGKFLRKWKTTVFEVARMADKGRLTGRRFHSYMATRCASRPRMPKMCRE